MNEKGISANPGWIALHILVILAGTIAAYSNSFDGEFVFDDEHVIVVNSMGGRYDVMPPPIGHFRSVVLWTIWLNYHLGGLEPFGYHVFNLGVHLATALLAYDLIRRVLLLPSFAGRFVGRASWLAFCAALLWAVHPLQTQAVTYITQRFESMMALFYVLTFYCFVRASTSTVGWRWLVGSAVSYALSMSCKEIPVTAPLVLVLFDRAYLSPSWKQTIDRWRPLLPVAVLAGIAIGGLAFARLADSPWVGFGSASHPLFDYLLSQPRSILQYFRVIYWPTEQTIDYQWPIVRDWATLLATGIPVSALLIGSVVLFWKAPKWGFPLLAFFIILSVTSSVLPIADLVVEHRLYLPSLCIIALTVLVVDALVGACLKHFGAKKTMRTAMVCCGLLLPLAVPLGFATYARNDVYNTKISLWTSVIEFNPKSERGWRELARAYRSKGETEEAINGFLHSVELVPTATDSHAALAHLFLQLEPSDPRSSLAKSHAEKSFEIDPLRYQSNYAMGKVLLEEKDFEAANPYLAYSVMKRPWHFQDRYDYVCSLIKIGDFDEAAAQLAKAEELSPGDARSVELLERAKTELQAASSNLPKE